MGLLRRHTDSHEAPHPAPESPDVRRFRFLLRTAGPEALDAVNEAALTGLGTSDRRDLLSVLQQQAAVGERADPDNVAALARFIRSSESRDPGVLLKNAPSDLLARLASRALATSAASGLLSGYDGWDGAEPAVEPEEGWKDNAYGKRFEAAMKQRRKDFTGGGGGLSNA